MRTRIAIDRDATLNARNKYGSQALVASFLDPITLLRVLDGEELVRAHDQGQLTGGVFSVPGERAHGACWATTPLEHLIAWGRGWQKRRLGKDLFVAQIQGQGRTFYHEDAEDFFLSRPFNPKGSAEQVTLADPGACNPGLGCALAVPFKDAEILRISGKLGPGWPKVTREEKATVCPMTRRDIEDPGKAPPPRRQVDGAARRRP